MYYIFKQEHGKEKMTTKDGNVFDVNRSLLERAKGREICVPSPTKHPSKWKFIHIHRPISGK